MTRVRDEVSQNFIPKPNFWQSWLTDAFLSGDMKETTRVFDKAIKFCPKMALIEEFLEFAMNKYDEDVISEEELRESFDKCIGIAGSNIFCTEDIWDVRRISGGTASTLQLSQYISSQIYLLFAALFLRYQVLTCMRLRACGRCSETLRFRSTQTF